MQIKIKNSKKILVYFSDFMYCDLNILSKYAKIIGNLPYNLVTHFTKNFIEQDIFFFIWFLQFKLKLQKDFVQN